MKEKSRAFWVSTVKPAEAYLALAAFNLLWVPSLGFGFLWDDATHVSFSVEQAWQRSQEHVFRPLYLLSFPLVSDLFGTAPWLHRMVNLAFLNVALIQLYRLFETPSRALLLAFAAVFTHPAIVFPATWIAARNDAMLLALIAIGLLQLQRGRTGFLPVFLSILCKAPFVLHGLVFAFVAALRGRFLVVSLFVLSVLILSWLSVSSGYRQQVDMLSLINSFDGNWMATFAARAAKGIEAVVLIFAPFPAFFHLKWWVFSIPVFLCVWFLICAGRGHFGVGNLRFPSHLEWARNHGVWLIMAGLLTLPPLMFNSQMRVLSVAAVLLQLGLVALCRDLPSRAPAFALLICLHLVGLLQNYRLSDTGYMTLDAVPPSQRTDQYCQTNRLPIAHWECERSAIVRKMVGSP